MGDSSDALQMILLTVCLGYAAYYALVHGYLAPLGLSGRVPATNRNLQSLGDSLQEAYGTAYANTSAPEVISTSPLPAPVFGNAIAEDTETLVDAYGTEELYRARAAAEAVQQVEGKMPLPMVAQPYSAVPLTALGGYNAAAASDAQSCASSCASKSSPLLRNNCKQACNKSLGVEISSYNNKVDFLRLLPGQG